MSVIEPPEVNLLDYVENLPSDVEEPITRSFFIRLGVALVNLNLHNKLLYAEDLATVAQHSDMKFQNYPLDAELMYILFKFALDENSKFVAGYFEFTKFGGEQRPRYRCGIHKENWENFDKFSDSTQSNESEGLLCTMSMS
jgi:hypothetical protein